MKKNVLIAILSIACICSLTWNFTHSAAAAPAINIKVMPEPEPFTVETDDVNVGAAIINQTRFGHFTGTFEVIPPDPTQVNAATTIILTYYGEE